jgi:hypothetical protein
MRRLLCLAALSLVVSAPAAHADILNIEITYVTGVMNGNNGNGGNVSFTLMGPGGTIISTSDAGMACFSWCSGPIPDLSFFDGPSQVYIGSFQTAILRGTAYDPINDFSISCCLFGSNGALNPTVSGFAGEGETFILFNLSLPAAGWGNFNFTFFPASGDNPAYYQFASATLTGGTPPVATPEPGTLGLMATGLAGLVGVIRRKRLMC